MQSSNAGNEWRECPTQIVTGEGFCKLPYTYALVHYAYCVLEVGPLPRGQGFVFENLTTETEIPAEFVSPLKDGVIEAMAKGVAGGYPITDVYIGVVDGRFHEVDSDYIGFRRAGALTFQDACSKAKMIILEPIATVTITTPQHFADSIQADLKQRRGEIMRQEKLLNHSCVVEAAVPLSETLGYSEALSQVTDGQAQVTITPNGYAEAPAFIADTLRAARERDEPKEFTASNMPVKRLSKRKQ